MKLRGNILMHLNFGGLSYVEREVLSLLYEVIWCWDKLEAPPNTKHVIIS